MLQRNDYGSLAWIFVKVGDGATRHSRLAIWCLPRDATKAVCKCIPRVQKGSTLRGTPFLGTDVHHEASITVLLTGLLFCKILGRTCLSICA